jgi:YtoQ family protein
MCHGLLFAGAHDDEDARAVWERADGEFEPISDSPLTADHAYDLAMNWQVYLSGEIHTDWRERIERGSAAAGLDVRFTAPVTDHAASDAAGTAILGEQERPFWNDHLGAGVNAIRTRALLERADIVVVRFGDQYRQWNAAFDAGYAAALAKPLITLHPVEHDHALKEVDRAASAVAREPEQVVEILRYVLAGLTA